MTEGIMLAHFHPRILPRLHVPPWCVEAIHLDAAQQADAEDDAAGGVAGSPTG
ncbi:hypothetical protein AB0I49_16910 [Streptomyces sp. NPDC050617]|uniref:hypothetical protein n=1 Tax=Streptomyces sp. NPDC050617 TaxID=3154628 RepID=UPI003420FA13